MAQVFLDGKLICEALDFSRVEGRRRYLDSPSGRIPGLKDADTFTLTAPFSATVLGTLDGQLEVQDGAIRYQLLADRARDGADGLVLSGVVNGTRAG
jgi:hypothetical protein